MLLYILLCGYPPFSGRNPNEIYKKILKANFYFNSMEWSSVSKLAKDFIKRLLSKHASNRISAAEALNDPWIKAFTGKNRIEKPICVNALSYMRNFHCERKLEAAVLAYITNFLSSKASEEKMIKIFRDLDADNDGILCEEELKEGF